MIEEYFLEVVMKNFACIALLSLLFGCGSKEDTGEDNTGEDDTGELEELNCTASIEFSVYVTVYDEAGEVLEGASVSYSSEEMSGDCEMDSVGGHYCGEEQSGDVTIFVSAEGYYDDEETVYILADECHVITQNLDITLSAVTN